MIKVNSLLLAGLLATNVGMAQTVLTLDASGKGPAIPSTMYGLFFEDINYGADGGLYAEMVKNRSFEFPQHLQGWKATGNVSVMEHGPFDRNPHYVRLSAATHPSKLTAVENEGFFGFSVRAGEAYRFTVWARVPDGEKANIRVELADMASMTATMAVASERITVSGKEWIKYAVVLKPNANTTDGTLRIFLEKPDKTAVDLEHVSLFPVNTFNGHENGLRKDLAEALADIKPGVFRFPGGCIVEGTEFFDRYQWKNTVGPVENRPTGINRWQFEFPHRFSPDYYQSNGLGFYEYFQLAEEIGAEPLPVLNVGMVCQYQNPDPKSHVSLDSLDEYIQDAIDLIEFANGDSTSVWGGLRASMGHPAPFNLKYLAIGNEQWGPEYVERLAPFVKEIRKKHPEIKIVGSAGPSADGDKFDYLWPEMRKLKVDLVDEHFYRNEDWFLANAGRYDKYPRKGPKVFAGEYACHPKGKKYNSFYAALCEAAFMTGLERNADVVPMATYAPLFAHEKGWQWRPDLIWFDNSDRHLTASYYVQRLYSHNKGTNVVPLTMNGENIIGQVGLYASAVVDKDKNCYIIKVVNVSNAGKELKLDIKSLPRNVSVTSATVTNFDESGKQGDYYYNGAAIKPEEILPHFNGGFTAPASTFSILKLYYTLKNKK